jgi:hypothetical protein
MDAFSLGHRRSPGILLIDLFHSMGWDFASTGGGANGRSDVLLRGASVFLCKETSRNGVAIIPNYEALMHAIAVEKRFDKPARCIRSGQSNFIDNGDLAEIHKRDAPAKSPLAMLAEIFHEEISQGSARNSGASAAFISLKDP